jgi:hypothetical protein
MSQENVEIVKAAQRPSGTELTALFADDAGAPELPCDRSGCRSPRV